MFTEDEKDLCLPFNPKNADQSWSLDHIGFPQLKGTLDQVLQQFYKLGFFHFWSVNQDIIYSDKTTLKSTVVSNFHETVKFPIFEPVEKLGKSQTQEFLDLNGGPGAQHIALKVDDIVKSVNELRNRGIKFLNIPDSYYESTYQILKDQWVKEKIDLDLL